MSISNLHNQPIPDGMNDRMPYAGRTFFEKAMNLHVQGIRNSLSYLPDPQHQQYYQWILNQDRIRDRWLQLVSVTKTIHMTEALLKGILEAEQMDFILPYTVIIDTYLMYEVVSDNLAIGLARHYDADNTFHERRVILEAFNTALSQLIRGQTTQTPADVLHPYTELIQQVSAFNQSLNPLQHSQIANAFLKVNPHRLQMHELEYGLYSSLVANMETCLDFVHAFSEFGAADMLRDGLARRYEGMNLLLQNDILPNETLATIGADTMLVVPVVGYYAAIIGEFLLPSAGYERVMQQGVLHQALHEASLLVRLLNDMGTLILRQSQDERDNLFERMRSRQHNYGTFAALLLDLAEADRAVMARLEKDLAFGEFNMGLHTALYAPTVPEAINEFEHQLHYIDTLYKQTHHSLAQHLNSIMKLTGGPAISMVIERFVQFHEEIYSQPFDNSRGEYAI